MSNVTVSTPQQTIDATYVTIEIMVGLLAIVGNSLVIVVFVKYEYLRTTTNYYVMSLALADLLVGLFGIPFAISTAMGLPSNFQACEFMNSLLLLLCTSSIFSLVAVSVDRFWAIQWPLTYPRRMTNTLAVWVICICWVLAAIVGLLPSMGWNKGEPEEPRCYFMEVIDMRYLATLYFTTILLPSALMAVVYCFIYKAVRDQITRMSEQMLPQENLKLQRRCLRKQTSAAKSIAVVVLLFIISWTPLYTFNTVICFCPACHYPPCLVKVLIVLSHCNSAWNPALYAWGMKDFRTALQRLCGKPPPVRYTSDYSPECLPMVRKSVTSLSSHKLNQLIATNNFKNLKMEMNVN